MHTCCACSYEFGLFYSGGAGGKGTWGKPGSELMMEHEEYIADRKDPNYDYENQVIQIYYIRLLFQLLLVSEQ